MWAWGWGGAWQAYMHAEITCVAIERLHLSHRHTSTSVWVRKQGEQLHAEIMLCIGRRDMRGSTRTITEDKHSTSHHDGKPAVVNFQGMMHAAVLR
jgi:hypothetical protein